MLVLGFLGSPRVNGHCSKLLRKALEGAESRGAVTKRYDLIQLNIKYCMGCNTCYPQQPRFARSASAPSRMMWRPYWKSM